MAHDPDHRQISGEPTTPADGRTRRLQRGDTLGDRFVIVQFLAEGGMGEVYEASDLHLQGKHCALKALRGNIAANPDLRQRFEREVLLAREVVHPNVCPTYDIFTVQAPDGPLTFLTMKLLRGESLLAMLKRVRSLELPLLTSIAQQLAQALDAAHRVGVIHRDFKPGNVMLEHSGSQDPRVSITDFGLSREHESEATLAQTGHLMGTPGYIAPELVEGRVAGFTADVYAFGVVLHEMATGQKPTRRGGKSDFVPPTDLAPGLPAVWNRIILGCLEPDPARRLQSAGEAMALLDASKSETRVTFTPARSRIRLWLVAAAVILLAVLGGWFVLRDVDALLHPLPTQRFVALMPWPADSNADHRPLLKSVLDTIGSRIARAEVSTKDLLIISARDVTGSTLSAPIDAVSSLGANLVLAASVSDESDGIRLRLAVLDAATSSEIRKTELHVSKSDLNRLPGRASVAAAKLLDVPVGSAQWKDEDDVGNVLPAAYVLLTRAEDAVAIPNDTGLDQAIELYQKALESDSRFGLAYARLSTAYARKFQLTRDRAFLTLAERNADLAMRYNARSAKSLLSRATVDRLQGKTQESMDGIQQALQLDPGNPQILMDKAFALRALDRRSEEQAVYKELLKERPNFWPAYYELGFALSRDGNYQQAADAFAEGSAVAPRVARLQTNLGTMYLYLDRKKDAEDAFRRSLDQAPNEVAYLNLGTLAFGAGDYRKALTWYEKARDLRPRNDVTWRNIADCYTMLGEPDRVKESYAKAAELAADVVRTNPTRTTSWMNLAFYEAKLGHGPAADEALRNAEARGNSDVQAQFKKVQVLALLGHREEAIQLLLMCLDRGLSTTDVELALDLKELRNDRRYQEAATGKNRRSR